MDPDPLDRLVSSVFRALNPDPCETFAVKVSAALRTPEPARRAPEPVRRRGVDAAAMLRDLEDHVARLEAGRQARADRNRRSAEAAMAVYEQGRAAFGRSRSDSGPLVAAVFGTPPKIEVF